MGYAAPAGPWAGGRFAVQGHMGARGLVAENTVAGCLAAFACGAAGVELDVRLSADGHAVVWHDATLQASTCTPTGVDYLGARVADLTLAQLRTVDVGSRTLAAFPRQRAVPGTRIATLAEILAACADAAPEGWWTVEVKVDPKNPSEVATRRRLVEATLAALHDHFVAHRCFIHSFDWAVLDLARQLDPSVLRSALAVPGYTYGPGSAWLGPVRFADFKLDLAGAAAASGAQVLAPHHAVCSVGLVRRAHGLGLAVLPWTVNDEAALSRVARSGADGVITDYPDVAVALLGRRAAPVA